MIVQEIKTGILYDTKYSKEFDEYWICRGKDVVRILKPCMFRYLLYDWC
ncbi:hypothetical protein [Clostridium amazonitimonense]|nr:hypothetical protein [Clostridium amazonitimonense]